jgi:hypothetical protein
MSETYDTTNTDGGSNIPEIPVGVAVKDEQAAMETMKGAVAVMDTLMQLRTTFKQEIPWFGIPLSSFPVRGPTPILEKRGIRMLYAPIPVGETADAFYKFLISEEGYKMIDQNANPKDFDTPVKGLGPWHLSDGEYDIPKFQVEYASMNIPPRDYVVLNGFDEGNKTFLSFSVQAATDTIPGSNVYEAEGVTKPGKNGKVRMAIFSALRVEADKENPNRCILHYFQWLDLLGNLSFASFPGNWVGYTQFIGRVQKKFPVST